MRIGGAARFQGAQNAGFTLLEMMLTVGLIAITATFVGLNISRSDEKLAELEARRFVALINMALDESIVTGRPILLNINADSRQYQFAPLDVPTVFVKGDLEQDEQVTDVAEYNLQNDSFYQPRQVPEAVKLIFSRLPALSDRDADAGMVPEAVHELLNKSLFESDDERLKAVQPEQQTVLIEPNGLISPFELTLSVEDRVSTVGLDAFGKATVMLTR